MYAAVDTRSTVCEHAGEPGDQANSGCQRAKEHITAVRPQLRPMP